MLGDIEACLTRNLCECILYFYGELCGIPENVPRFLKNAFHIPEERHLGLASLWYKVVNQNFCMFKFLSGYMESCNRLCKFDLFFF